MIKIDDVAKETLCVFNYFDLDFLAKIPYYVIEDLKNTSKTSQIIVDIDTNEKLENQNISEECKDLISLIYYKYIATDGNKKEILNCWKKNENKDINKQSKIIHAFKKYNNEETINSSSTINTGTTEENCNLPQITKENNFIKKFWNCVKKIFHIKN